MQDLNVALVAIGSLTVVLSLVSGLVKSRAYVVSEPMAAVILGVVAGPLGFGWLSIETFGDPFVILEQFTRLTVGLAVMAAALRLPRRYIREHLRGMGAILGPGMVGMWLVSALLTYALLGVSPWFALLVGAIVTPTDPVLAGSIVTGSMAVENIPERVRDLLTAESGANDGLAYPIVFLPVLLLEHPPQRALVDWLLQTLLWEVGVAVLLGAAAGTIAGLLEQTAHGYDVLEETSLVSVTIALTLAVVGGVKLLGSDGILAAFVAGLLFNQFADAGDKGDEQRFQESLLRLLTIPSFVILGLVLPVREWLALGWAGVALAVGILLFRRLPVAVVLDRYVSPIDGRTDASFAGWFGPIGIAALFYATVAHRLVGEGVIFPAVTLVVTGSVIVHGLTAAPFTKLYGRQTDVEEDPEGDTGTALGPG